MLNDSTVFSGVTPVFKRSGQACSNQALEAVFLVPGGTHNWRFPEDVLAYFQPIYSVYQERIVAVEALARVQASNGEILSPTQFLPFLSLGQRRELSRQMLMAGIALLEALDAKGISLDLSFNVDPDFMEDQDCVPCFLGVLGSTTITPQRITLELLESGDFLQGDIAVRRLQALCDTGAQIALDDIGSAYSSLLRLKNLPIQKIKLDQELVRDLDREPKIMAFLQSMKFLADGLGATLIVEGVETATILDAVAQLQQDLVQGYAISRPMPAEAFIALAQNHMRPAISFTPGSLLGAYAAHVLRRPLMYSLQSNHDISSLIQYLDDCPLLDYLRAHPCQASAPVLDAYAALLNGVRNRQHNMPFHQQIAETEGRLQVILYDAIRAERRDAPGA
ncbi:EAL domain-containing protein [Acidithiobacillus sp. AMEEHan]|uniref:EAL domain-containing protein n=1 Tax=Acidithiobacillus sp. AMEEHan TaxID=2994951 RepID=UPI0027E55E97|nr:EAL domain-containing protein [Acidithiobacillus sp. AMEEHan]